MALEFKLYQFRLVIRDNGHLNGFLGTTLHGGLGNVLKQSACSRGVPPSCDRCNLEQGCVYSAIYESRSNGDPYGADRPHPLTLRVPGLTPVKVLPGERIEFDILLLGKFCKDAFHIIDAFEQLGHLGLGWMSVRYDLESVKSLPEHKIIYENGSYAQDPLPSPNILKPDYSRLSDTYTVNLQSPLRLKIKGELLKSMDQISFLSAARVRYVALCRNYGFDLEQELLPPVSEACLKDNKTSWFEQERYSGRSGNKKIEYGGLVGSFTITGLTPESAFYLKAGQILQIGKGTAMGMGLYSVKSLNRLKNLLEHKKGEQVHV